MIDVPSELMCSATKDTDPPRGVIEVAAWKLAFPTQSLLGHHAGHIGGQHRVIIEINAVNYNYISTSK